MSTPFLAESYEIACPPGMLAHGQRVKRFTSLHAFEGYLGYLATAGYVVTHQSACVARVDSSRS